MLFDNITTEITALKHYALSLRQENIEMKQNIADLTSSRFDLTTEVKQLRQMMSQLMEQQTVFNASLNSLHKETKTLMRDNMQIKSKYEIFQVRLKNLQGSHDRESVQRLSPARLSSPPQMFGSSGKQDPDGDKTPRQDNALNKSTKDRLENLRKDLEDVFKKREEQNEESPRGEKETIMEEWSNPSELNISQSHSDRSQITVITCPPGEHSFNIGYNQGQPSSLMEQVEMLNMPQKDNFLYENILDISPRGGASGGNTHKSDSKKKEAGEKKNTFTNEVARLNKGNFDIVSGSLQGGGMHMDNQSKAVMNSKINSNIGALAGSAHSGITQQALTEEKKISSAKPTTVPPLSSQPLRPLIPLNSTVSTTLGATQSSLLGGADNYSYYPMYPASDGNYMQNFYPQSQIGQKVAGREPLSGNNAYPESGIRGLGIMDIQTKKELYLKEENMLVKVLDRLDEQPYKSSLHFPTENQQQLDSDVYRYISKDTLGMNQPHSNQVYGYMQPMSIPESEKIYPNDTSTTLSTGGTSQRGTKKLRLFRKSLKQKEEFPSPKNTDYGNQRLHTD